MDGYVTQASLFEMDIAEIDASAMLRPAKKAVTRQAQLGQFLTPKSIADFMAGLFTPSFPIHTKLLDAGAGRGALAVAFIEQWRQSECAGRLEVNAYETDDVIRPDLASELHRHAAPDIAIQIIEGDFISLASTMVALERGERFTHAILNPPYKKISSESLHRAQLRAAGLETVNLYSGFVALALALLNPTGELVAIVPRSFCNGPYYQPFRTFLLRYSAIDQIHLFESRTKAFKSDNVLQENVIIKLTKGKRQGPICISTSTDDSFADLKTTRYPFDRVVMPDDENQFIHIPTSEDDDDILRNAAFRFSLEDLGLHVSTGPVVDFRMREHLVADPANGTVPLLYPGHFVGQTVEWPRTGFKKPNCIRDDATTRKWLYPNGFYTVTKRFSSKEEKRRLVASIIDPNKLPGEWIGIENHMNVIHAGRQPLSENLARGLSVYLNSSVIERYFRRFNGHTQVNATDLRTLPYPDRNALIALGIWAKAHANLDQVAIDASVNALA